MIKSKVVTVLFMLIYLESLILCCEALQNKDKVPSCYKTFLETRRRTKLIYDEKKCKARSCVINEIHHVIIKKPTCCVGWQWVHVNNTCTPRCKNGCENGICVAPEVCQCDPPLVLKNNACLLPVCDPPCGSNSRCTADNTCSCDDNFLSINATHCAPTCLTGYINDPIECKPKCDKTCVNATCIAPNTCTCIEGHRMVDNYTCLPECKPSCENAECVAPKTCQCFDGFIKENSSKCIPKCDRCNNGDCVAPNTCQCHEGYEKKDGICIPICDHLCTNGICSAPNTCSCNLGYTLNSTNKYNCLPICERECINASCVSPNTCSCLTGYYMTGNNWTCSPRCDNCENGECVAPNNCNCYIGYTKEANKCRPICDQLCKNGICSKPNECTCNMGFAIDKTDKFYCKPVCRDDCVNSTCVSPGKCQCLPGYESTLKENICKPRCASCIHGQCVSPDFCQCDLGYYMSNGACLPICSSPCMNGHCSSPETCSCEAGFKKNLDEPHICYKECDGFCNNGKCTLQGECICDRGFDLVNDTCIKKEPVDCDTCNCTDGDCWCLDGNPCLLPLTHSDEVASPTSLAGLELTWVFGCAVGLLMLILLMAIIIQMSRRKLNPENKAFDNGVVYGSVVYTAPNRLMTSRPIYDNVVTQEDTFYEEVPSRYHEGEEEATNEGLLDPPHRQHNFI